MTRQQFQKKYNTIYRWLLKNDEKLLKKLLPRTLIKWTDKMLIADAKKYKNRYAWSKASGSSYGVAYSRGLVDVCCAHMEPSQNKNIKVYCPQNKKTYKSIVAAAKELKLTRSHLASHLKGKYAHVKGYTFKYVDK